MAALRAAHALDSSPKNRRSLSSYQSTEGKSPSTLSSRRFRNSREHSQWPVMKTGQAPTPFIESIAFASSLPKSRAAGQPRHLINGSSWSMCKEVDPKYTTSHLFTEAPLAKFRSTDRIERIDQGSESPSKTLSAAVIPLEEHIKPVDDVPVAISFGCVPNTSHKN